MRLPTIQVTAVLAAGWLAAQPAYAGRSCEERKPSAASIERGLRLAERAHEALESAHARDATEVVFLARMGQDLSRYGLRYSHLGIAYRSRDAQGQPTWRVLHKLNHCGTSESAIYRQGLGEFFLDDLWRHEGAWVVPARDRTARPYWTVRLYQRRTSFHAGLRFQVPYWSSPFWWIGGCGRGFPPSHAGWMRNSFSAQYVAPLSQRFCA